MADSQAWVLGAGADGQPVTQSFRVANRHGLIAGARGTGKTVTLQRLIESFSDAGVAVFAADIKGDLCGLGAAGAPAGRVAERIASMPWLAHSPRAYPLTLWDVDGRSGHPLRTTLSEMGPLLLANLLQLTDSQQAALYAIFQVADREGLLLLDIKDLKALVSYLLEQPQALGDDAALFTRPSAQALLRKLATLEQQGAEALFGEPALQLEDILQPAPDGRGRIHLLDASRLVHEAPKVYATFLLWLLAELFEQLPERGDADRPLLALFFDEAHPAWPACFHRARAEGAACRGRWLSAQPAAGQPQGSDRTGDRRGAGRYAGREGYSADGATGGDRAAAIAHRPFGNS
jgi:DNA helicase HerA-like ATPase